MEATSVVKPIESPPVDHSSISIALDKPFYLPGQRAQGQVQLNLKTQTDLKSLGITLQGTETTHSYVYSKRGGSFNSSRAMANSGLWLSQGASIPAGCTSFPFFFVLPPDALPSYSGKHSDVLWKLSAKASIGWRHDLEQEIFFLVANAFPIAPQPATIENQEVQPRIRLGLSSNIYQPGEMLVGRLALLAPGNARAVRLQLCISEYATAKGAYGNNDTTEVMPVGNPLEFSIDSFSTAPEVPFGFTLPSNSPNSYKGTYSSINWYIYSTIDIPHGSDIHFSLPFTVGIRTPSGKPSFSDPSPNICPTLGSTIEL